MLKKQSNQQSNQGNPCGCSISSIWLLCCWLNIKFSIVFYIRDVKNKSKNICPMCFFNSRAITFLFSYCTNTLTWLLCFFRFLNIDLFIPYHNAMSPTIAWPTLPSTQFTLHYLYPSLTQKFLSLLDLFPKLWYNNNIKLN